MNGDWKKRFDLLKEFCDKPETVLCCSMHCSTARNLIAAQLSKTIAENIQEEKAFFVTVYLKRFYCDLDKLSECRLNEIKAVYKRKLAIVPGIDRAIGALEFQQMCDLDTQNHTWQIHLHAYIQTSLSHRQLFDALSRVFPLFKGGKKPVKVKRITHWPPKTRYLFKNVEKTHSRVSRNGNMSREIWNIQGEALKQMKSFVLDNPLSQWIFDYSRR